MESIQKDTYLSPDQFWRASQEQGIPVGRTSIYEGLKAGRIKSVRIGRKYLIPRTEVTGWLEREAEAVLE